MFSLAKYQPIKYEGEPYPVWAEATGWLITLCSMLFVPIVAVYKLLTAKGSLAEVNENTTFVCSDNPQLLKYFLYLFRMLFLVQIVRRLVQMLSFAVASFVAGADLGGGGIGWLATPLWSSKKKK